MSFGNARGAQRRAMSIAGTMLAAAALLLAGCGGGGGGGGGVALLPPGSGGGGGSGDPSGDSLSSLAATCAAPRTGIDPATSAAFPDRAGTLDDEKRWVRAWIDQTYLWYSEVPATLVAADYATPLAYFNVLKTPALTPSGRAKDRFHYTYDTEVYRQQSQGGVSADYGMEFAFVRNSRPRDLRVAYTEPGSPAAQQDIARGAKITKADGVDVINGTDTATINAAISPKAIGESHTFELLEGSATRTVTLTAAKVTSTPVQNVRSIDTANGRVGYMQFNSHVGTAEKQLVAAVNQLRSDGVTDLVLDMRYNGGGLLAIASELAYMVAPAAATFGTVFERLSFNDKNPFGMTTAQATMPFYATTRGYSLTAGQPLPKLGLSHVTVLTGPDTCSASESVINSLRGVGVAVDLVGASTCGKPYGFYPEDNCGTTYFAIQFKGVNQQGFGDYGDGFAPACTVADDFDHPLGDPGEARLAAALALRSGGSCPAAVSADSGSPAALEKASAAPESTPYLLNRSPLLENRLVDLRPLPQ